MIRIRSIAGLCAGVVLSGILFGNLFGIATGGIAFGQEPMVPTTAPVPQALMKAKKIFLSNAGADSGLFPHPFSGDPDRALQPVLCRRRELGAVSGGRHSS